MAVRKRKPISQADMDAACDFLFKAQHDPLFFVQVAFPWGEKGTPLEHMTGPFDWQKEVLEHIKNASKDIDKAIKIAVASGNGIGKSALVSWIIIWAFSTYPDSRGVVTANTEKQLTSKTWAELNKWYGMYILKDFFALNGLRLHSIDEGSENTWRVDATPWSKDNPEAMAGLHNLGKREFIIFDEASAIDSVIWETMEGAMSDANTEKIWVAFGNPTRRDGAFYDCFHKNRDVWWHRQVNSETVPSVSKSQIEDWRREHGVDSDWYRVHVLGQFPSSNEMQFIPTKLVDEAMHRTYKPGQFKWSPIIIGVDMSWTGKDKIKICMRQGLYAEKLLELAYNNNDLDVAAQIAYLEDKLKADAVFIDFGYGQGVYSAGQKWGRDWQLVPFQGKSNLPQCFNKRSEMYYRAKSWLEEGGSFSPDWQELADDLTAPELVWNSEGLIQLESKKDIKKRLERSTDDADSFVLTFAFPVQKKDMYSFDEPEQEYDPFAGM